MYQCPYSIDQLLPHRYPFLMVDSIVDYCPGKSITGVRYISHTDPWLSGGVALELLSCESLAQLSKALDQMDLPKDQRGALSVIAAMDVQFGVKVHAGDKLELHVEVERRHDAMVRFRVTAHVDGKLVISGTMTRRLEAFQTHSPERSSTSR